MGPVWKTAIHTDGDRQRHPTCGKNEAMSAGTQDVQRVASGISRVRQGSSYRYAVKREMIEIPAGKLDQNEIPEKCALRELEEEIGYRANKLTLLANIHPAVGFTDEKMWLYLAEDLVKTKQSLDADEFLEPIPTKLDDAVKMVWNGQITDVKTIIGILWAQRMLLVEG